MQLLLLLQSLSSIHATKPTTKPSSKPTTKPSSKPTTNPTTRPSSNKPTPKPTGELGLLWESPGKKEIFYKSVYLIKMIG